MYEELVKSLREQADYYCCHMGINSPPAMMFVEAADAIEDLNKTLDEEVEINTALECNMPVWIPVTERLPPIGEDVIVFADRTTIRIWSLERYHPTIADVFWEREDGFHEGADVVSHWMPLPKPPKDGAE